MDEVGVILAVDEYNPVPSADGIALRDTQTPGIPRLRAAFVGAILAVCRGNSGAKSGLSGASYSGGAANPAYCLRV